MELSDTLFGASKTAPVNGLPTTLVLTVKKLFFSLVLVFFSSFAHALYQGNPALPKCPEEGFYIAKEASLGLRLGYEGDFVWDRKMTNRTDKFEILENFGTLTATLFDRLDLYASAGGLSAEIRQQRPGTGLEFNSHTGAAWKVGARGVLYQYGNTFVSLQAAYLQTHASLKEIALNGTPLERKGGSLFYRELGASLGVAHKIAIFIPYIGVEGSYAAARLKNLRSIEKKRIEMHSRSPVGLLLGCGFSPGVKVIVNLEVRLVDEKAVTLAGDIKF